MADVVDRAMTLLYEAGSVFQRGGRLARVAHIGDPRTSALQRPTILLVDEDWLRLELDRIAAFHRSHPRYEGHRKCDCPRDVASRIIANAGAWPFPELVACLTVPTLRSDGTLVARPGFDRESGLHLTFDASRFSMPEKPTPEEGIAALETLLKLLKDFPFETGADRSVALSAILTSLIRPSLPAAPAHAFSAPVMGTGKSLLADVVSLIATGSLAPCMSHTDNPTDEEKRILALLLKGEPIVCIDNVNGPYKSDSMCIALTQGSFMSRILGRSESATLTTRSTLWLFTGNNIHFAGDMSTRALRSRLNAKCEQPEDRDFDVDLKTWIPAHRLELVAAGLTLLRAYIAAGQPRQPFTRLGRFEAWSDLVRSSLVWAGMDDPVNTRQAVKCDDPSKRNARALLEAWHAVLPEQWTTIASLSDQIFNRATHDTAWAALRDAVITIAGDGNRDINGKSLGKWLSSHTDRIHGDLTVEKGGNVSQSKWRVTRVDPV